MKNQFNDINYARGYYSRLWDLTNTNSKIVELESHWEKLGKLKELRTPIPKREYNLKPFENTSKPKELKFYNHLPIGELVAEKTEDRERLENIWAEENQDYLLERQYERYKNN